MPRAGTTGFLADPQYQGILQVLKDTLAQASTLVWVLLAFYVLYQTNDSRNFRQAIVATEKEAEHAMILNKLLSAINVTQSDSQFNYNSSLINELEKVLGSVVESIQKLQESNEQAIANQTDKIVASLDKLKSDIDEQFKEQTHQNTDMMEYLTKSFDAVNFQIKVVEACACEPI